MCVCVVGGVCGCLGVVVVRDVCLCDCCGVCCFVFDVVCLVLFGLV